MLKLFKLSFVTTVRQKSVFLVLLLLTVLPFVFLQMTNVEVDADVGGAAVAQAVWQLAWVAACFWLVYCA